MKTSCGACMNLCSLSDGQTGNCGARRNVDGRIVCINYGRISSMALDPIEKKPLARFCAGGNILSVGSFGCNLRCPFCQNYDISQARESLPTSYVSPEQLAETALSLKDRNNIGVAFTYNEPLVGYEYVIDTAPLIWELGMKTVLVTNGAFTEEIANAVLPLIDAANIDLKGFTEEWYRRLGGDLETVKRFITIAAEHCHVELTTLIVPGENDSEDEMERLSDWAASIDKSIPLHVSRFFPRYKMQDKRATDIETVYRLADVARKNLKYVYTGNC